MVGIKKEQMEFASFKGSNDGNCVTIKINKQMIVVNQAIKYLGPSSVKSDNEASTKRLQVCNSISTINFYLNQLKHQSMKKNNNKYTSLSLQSLRDKLIKDIKSNWRKIYLFNTIEPSKGEVRNFNLDEVYKEIIKFENKLIKVKCGIQFMNMLSLAKRFGFTLQNYNDNTPHETIFKLQQLKERLQKLEQLPVENKSKTADIALNKSFIDKEVKLLLSEASKCGDQLDLFNKKLEIEIELD